jgi:hypothetical protein
MTRDDLMWVHAEQVRFRYPDALHIRLGWGTSPTRIESKVSYGDGIDIFVSVLKPDGTVQHFAQVYKRARRNGLFKVRRAVRRMRRRLIPL